MKVSVRALASAIDHHHHWSGRMDNSIGARASTLSRVFFSCVCVTVRTCEDLLFGLGLVVLPQGSRGAGGGGNGAPGLGPRAAVDMMCLSRFASRRGGHLGGRDHRSRTPLSCPDGGSPLSLGRKRHVSHGGGGGNVLHKKKQRRVFLLTSQNMGLSSYLQT